MTQRHPNRNRSNRNFKASEAFDGTGIKRAGQFEARFPHTLSQITLKLVPFGSVPFGPRSLTEGLMNGVIAHGLTIFDRLNLPPVSGQVSHFNMIGIKPRPLALLRDV